MLIGLREMPDVEPQEPTIDVLRQRSRHLAELVESVSRRGNTDRHAQLAKLHAEYVASLASLEHAAHSIEALELKVIGELGDTLVWN